MTWLRRASEPPAGPHRPALVPSRRLSEQDLPIGISRDRLFDMLASLSIDDAPPAELSAYLTEDFERFVITWSLARNATGRALEIGANPYFTTILLRELTSLDLTLTNFFAPDDPAVVRAQSVEYRDLAGTTTRRQMPYRPVNVESDRFPFDDGAFDIVFFCEVIEHLQTDPIVAIDEIHRVLRPGGRLVLTTPNVARLENVARLVAGANLYDPYSGYGAYGRHNREFTRHELHRVLDYRGFANIESFTSDVHDHRAGNFVDVDSLAELVADRQPDLGQYIFVTAERARLDPDRAARRPSFLYRSMPAGVIEEYE